MLSCNILDHYIRHDYPLDSLQISLTKLTRMADWVANLEANDRIARVDDQTVLDDGTSDPRPGTLRQLTSMFGRALTERGEAEHLSHEAKANLVLGFCALRTDRKSVV